VGADTSSSSISREEAGDGNRLRHLRGLAEGGVPAGCPEPKEEVSGRERGQEALYGVIRVTSMGWLYCFSLFIMALDNQSWNHCR